MDTLNTIISLLSFCISIVTLHRVYSLRKALFVEKRKQQLTTWATQIRKIPNDKTDLEQNMKNAANGFLRDIELCHISRFWRQDRTLWRLYDNTRNELNKPLPCVQTIKAEIIRMYDYVCCESK